MLNSNYSKNFNKPKKAKNLAIIEENCVQKTPETITVNQRFTQYEVINALYDSQFLGKTKLTASTKLVLIAMARHYNPANEDFFPSYACISSHTGVSKKSVERAIKELVDAKLITYRTEKVNRYRFTGHFFACVKLTTPQRQNDDTNLRQIDEQTNKHEKRINNINNFNNFSDCEKSQNIDKKQISACKQQVHSQQIPQNFDKNEVIIFPATGEKFKNYRQNGAHYNANYYSQNNQKGGSSCVPSVLETSRYIENLRQSRCEATSPLDYDPERAKAWYESLSPILKTSVMAKKVAEKLGKI